VVLDDGKATDVPHGLTVLGDDELEVLDEDPSGEHWADEAGSGVRVSA